VPNVFVKVVYEASFGADDGYFEFSDNRLDFDFENVAQFWFLLFP
jgi:hypothetical protein